MAGAKAAGEIDPWECGNKCAGLQSLEAPLQPLHPSSMTPLETVHFWNAVRTGWKEREWPAIAKVILHCLMRLLVISDLV